LHKSDWWATEEHEKHPPFYVIEYHEHVKQYEPEFVLNAPIDSSEIGLPVEDANAKHEFKLHAGTSPLGKWEGFRKGMMEWPYLVGSFKTDGKLLVIDTVSGHEDGKVLNVKPGEWFGHIGFKDNQPYEMFANAEEGNLKDIMNKRHKKRGTVEMRSMELGIYDHDKYKAGKYWTTEK